MEGRANGNLDGYSYDRSQLDARLYGSFGLNNSACKSETVISERQRNPW